MKRILVVSLFAVAVAAANAQVSKPVGLSVRGGIVFPASGYGRDLGKTWFGIGGDFKLSDLQFGQKNMGTNSFLTLSADYYGKGEASAVPVLVNYMSTQNEFFYSVGAGLAFTRDRDGGNDRSKANFAYQLGLGYNFQQGQTPLFVEAKYFGNSNSRVNAFGVYVGIRL